MARTQKSTAKKTPAKKAGSTAAPTPWNSEEARTPADLTRAGLLANIPDEEIRAAVAERFPDYKALGICVSVYRRELKKKGLLE